jgi:hypothetical protein
MRNITSAVREYDAWEHVCLDAFDNPKRGVIALLFPMTAYLDASLNKPSPTRPNPPLIHTVGGYLALYADWKKFRKEWRIELNKKDVPHFHMKDFEYAQAAIKRGEREKISRKNPFKNWDEGEFVPFQNRLYGVINRKNKDGEYRMASFNSSVVMADFDETLPDELKDDPECASYYIFNVANVMKQIALWCSSHIMYNHPIHYIFAGGDKEGSNIENWFDYCWNSEQDKNYFRLNKGYTRMGYDIQWMQAEPALQAADVAAFEFNKVALKVVEWGGGDIPKSEMRKSLSPLCRAEHYSYTLTKEVLPGAFAQIIRRR